MVWLMAYLSTGAFVGFLAGLLGIGGGMTLVPILATLFAAQGLAPEHTVHLALGTGMASIAFTSGSSVREHHRHTAVDWKVVARMVPGICLAPSYRPLPRVGFRNAPWPFRSRPSSTAVRRKFFSAAGPLRREPF